MLDHRSERVFVCGGEEVRDYADEPSHIGKISNAALLGNTLGCGKKNKKYNLHDTKR